MPATVECKCGGVKLTLPNPTPKGCCYCACNSCLQRCYISNNGTPPDAIKILEEPITLYYIDSTLMKPDADTLAKLDYFVLRDDATATNIHVRATCCGTLLFCQHPGFHVPHTMATFGGVKNTFVDPPKPTCTIRLVDWPADKAKALESSIPLPQSMDVTPEELERDIIKELLGWLGQERKHEPDGEIMDIQDIWKGKPMKYDNSFHAEATAAKPAAKPAAKSGCCLLL